MAFEGMDVDQVLGLARQVEQQAQGLSQVAALASVLAGQLTYHWQGPVAAMFQQDWESRHRPALSAAHQAMSDLHGRLITQAQQQQGASAAAGGGSGASGAIAGIAAAWHAIEWTDSNVGPIVDIGKWLSEDKSVTGRYTKSWDQVRSDWRSLKDTLHLPVDSSDDFLRYKSWPGIQAAHNLIEKTHAGPVFDVADKILNPVGIVLAVASGAEAINDVSQGHYSAAIDQTSDALKGSKGLYLEGVALESLHVAYEEGAKIDWSEEMPAPTVDNLRTIYLPGAWDGLREFPSDLKEILF